MHHLTMFSAGGGSWKTAKIVQSRLQPGDTHKLFFTDTLYEDADAYRFLIEGAANVFGRKLNWIPRAGDFPDYRVDPGTPIENYRGNPAWRDFLEQMQEMCALAIPELIWVAEGRDPWEIYRDERFLGNSQADPCSKKLKRELSAAWLKAECDPADTVLHYGIGEHESHRYDDGKGHGIRPRMEKAGWRAEAPLVGNIEGLISPTVLMRSERIAPPRLYGKGYSHNNCGGMCCKAGKGHWAHRFAVDRERFEYDALMESKIMAFLGRDDIAMIGEQVRGQDAKQPLTLYALKRRLQAGWRPTLFDQNSETGCGCMTDEAA